jgi:hydroxymethylpyrimidine pyrophosphatase-like HAD family hydrolase
MIKYPLVLSDIDGTLVDDNGAIPDHVVQAVQAYSQAGGHFVLASARPPLAMVDIARQLDLTVSLVTLNGSLIVTYDPHAGSWEWNDQEAAITGTWPLIKPLAQRLATGLTVHKMLAMAAPTVIDELTTVIAAHPEWHVNASRSKDTYLEISDASVSKQSALHLLADHFNISLAQTMAIGDGDNDLPMLTTAGLGIATGNARPTVLAQAAQTVASNTDGGVAEALNDYALVH